VKHWWAYLLLFCFKKNHSETWMDSPLKKSEPNFGGFIFYFLFQKKIVQSETLVGSPVFQEQVIKSETLVGSPFIFLFQENSSM
jgi:hypothetical protein